MPKKSGGLQELLQQELQDLFDAEKQLVKALPKMAKSASDPELETALREHLEVARNQVQRLEQVFQSMDMRARSRPCKGLKGLVEEGKEMMEEFEEGILDSALTGAARKVEHYEMMAYESVRSMAQQLGQKQAAQLLGETLQEEVEADRQLAKISKRLVKEAEAGGGMSEESGRSERSGGSRRSQPASRRSSSRKSAARSSSARSSGSRRGSGASSRPLTDHEEIRQWAEQRNAHPACVKGTGKSGDVGMIRLDFPGFSGGDSLQEISWDDWFQQFDENNLALLVQEQTSGGKKSNFNKLVSRQAESAGRRPKTRAAR